MSTEPIDLDAAQALVDAATPGPWTSWRKIPGVIRIETTTGDALVYHDPVDEDGQLITESDAEFIAQARTLVPALIAELREARSLIDESTERWSGLNRRVAHLGNNLSVQRAGRTTAEAKLAAVRELVNSKRQPHQGHCDRRFLGPDVACTCIVGQLRAVFEGGE